MTRWDGKMKRKNFSNPGSILRLGARGVVRCLVRPIQGSCKKGRLGTNHFAQIMTDMLEKIAIHAICINQEFKIEIVRQVDQHLTCRSVHQTRFSQILDADAMAPSLRTSDFLAQE